jgi:ComF family protein
MRKQPAIDCILSSFAFETTLRHVLHRYKYHEGLYLTAFLATLMLEALPTHYTTQCLIPIPMHRAQLKRRGYNQAQLLAQYLGRAIHRPVNTSHCEKIRDTANQAGLSARMRQGNLRHAFLVKKIPYRHVTLVDDLITTGSTTNELARTLKRTGVERVDVWCCAKTVLTEFDA